VVDQSGVEGDAITDVLMVDSSDPIRTTTAEILRLEGFTVAGADDGEIALRFLTQRRFRAVLLELDPSKGSDIEILEAMDDLPPVVILFGATIDLDDFERLKHKLVGYPQKPVRPRVLIDTVTALLPGRARHRLVSAGWGEAQMSSGVTVDCR
jgi:DNA-binding response OmpR family regulator